MISGAFGVFSGLSVVSVTFFKFSRVLTISGAVGVFSGLSVVSVTFF